MHRPKNINEITFNAVFQHLKMKKKKLCETMIKNPKKLHFFFNSHRKKTKEKIVISDPYFWVFPLKNTIKRISRLLKSAQIFFTEMHRFRWVLNWQKFNSKFPWRNKEKSCNQWQKQVVFLRAKTIFSLFFSTDFYYL